MMSGDMMYNCMITLIVLYSANKVMRIDRSGCSCYVHFRGSNTCVSSSLGGHRYCTVREIRKNRHVFPGVNDEIAAHVETIWQRSLFP